MGMQRVGSKKDELKETKTETQLNNEPVKLCPEKNFWITTAMRARSMAWAASPSPSKTTADEGKCISGMHFAEGFFLDPLPRSLESVPLAADVFQEMHKCPFWHSLFSFGRAWTLHKHQLCPRRILSMPVLGMIFHA